MERVMIPVSKATAERLAEIAREEKIPFRGYSPRAAALRWLVARYDMERPS